MIEEVPLDTLHKHIGGGSVKNNPNAIGTQEERINLFDDIELPSDFVGETPFAPAETPFGTPHSEVPFETHAELPFETHAEAPSEASFEASFESSSEAPEKQHGVLLNLINNKEQFKELNLGDKILLLRPWKGKDKRQLNEFISNTKKSTGKNPSLKDIEHFLVWSCIKDGVCGWSLGGDEGVEGIKGKEITKEILYLTPLEHEFLLTTLRSWSHENSFMLSYFCKECNEENSVIIQYKDIEPKLSTLSQGKVISCIEYIQISSEDSEDTNLSEEPLKCKVDVKLQSLMDFILNDENEPNVHTLLETLKTKETPNDRVFYEFIYSIKDVTVTFYNEIDEPTESINFVNSYSVLNEVVFFIDSLSLNSFESLIKQFKSHSFSNLGTIQHVCKNENCKNTLSILIDKTPNVLETFL